MAAPKSHRTLRLPPDLDIWVEQQAREADLSVNEWLRRVLQWVRGPHGPHSIVEGAAGPEEAG